MTVSCGGGSAFSRFRVLELWVNGPADDRAAAFLALHNPRCRKRHGVIHWGKNSATPPPLGPCSAAPGHPWITFTIGTVRDGANASSTTTGRLKPLRLFSTLLAISRINVNGVQIGSRQIVGHLLESVLN
jgi:hypothetical protein